MCYACLVQGLLVNYGYGETEKFRCHELSAYDVSFATDTPVGREVLAAMQDSTAFSFLNLSG
jgi:hypothetical protein